MVISVMLDALPRRLITLHLFDEVLGNMLPYAVLCRAPYRGPNRAEQFRYHRHPAHPDVCLPPLYTHKHTQLRVRARALYR